MITRITPDRQKSEALKETAKVTFERLESTDKGKYPSNTLVDHYDIIHKLLEALTLLEGVKMRGESAHYELIDYVTSRQGFDEQTRQFIQQMRDYRNRIAYEGFSVSRNYLALNEKMIQRVIGRLFALLSKPNANK